jgi:DNA-binding winged helix-turn-helix (wHTH) protein
MGTHNSRREIPNRNEPALVGADPRTSEPRSASMHLLNSATRPRQQRGGIRRTPMPSWPRNETAELLADIDGLPVLLRFLVDNVPIGPRSDFAGSDAGIHSALSSTLEKIVDRMRASFPQRDTPSKQPLGIVEVIAGADSLVRPSPNETVLRVGSLQLDLMNRTATRGDRQIELRPREFQLLKYMMQRSEKLLTRAALFKEVWHYKFVPESNLVDVHMGRLRRKIDGPDDAPIIRSVRGAGFVLSATPLSPDLPAGPAERSTSLPAAAKSTRATNATCSGHR